LELEGSFPPAGVHDIEGVHTVVASFHHPSSLVAATLKHKLTLIYNVDHATGRLFLSAVYNPGINALTKPGLKTLLVYLATPHPACFMKNQL
jgi:hypothetical protein